MPKQHERGLKNKQKTQTNPLNMMVAAVDDRMQMRVESLDESDNYKVRDFSNPMENSVIMNSSGHGLVVV